MTARIIVAAALGLAVAGLSVQAGAETPHGAPPDYQHCIASAGQRSSALVKCEQAAYRRADKALNDAYSDLEDKVEPAAKDPLVRAQRDWLGYRSSECAYEAARAAADAAIVEARCMRRLTEARTQDLQ
jgi:uncharacterized protein YecT (DUF1311 family)